MGSDDGAQAGLRDATALLLRISSDDPVVALETIAEALRSRCETYTTSLELVDACRDRMASAVAAGGDSGGLSLDGGCQPSSPQSISCGGDGQVAHSDGGTRSQPRPSTVNQHSTGPYRGPSMLREPGAGPGPTSKAPGRGGFFLHLRGTDDLLGQGVGGVRSHRVRDGRGGEGGGGGSMSTPNESSTTVSKRPPPSPHLLAATVLPPPRASRCLSRTPRRSSPAVLSPPLPPPPPAKRASATSPSLQMRLQHARPGTATARVSVPGAHPVGGGEGGKSRGCAGGVEGWATVGYGPTETQVTRWKKDREAAEDDKEESMRRVVVKSRLFIEQIFNTKRPWRNDAIV